MDRFDSDFALQQHKRRIRTLRGRLRRYDPPPRARKAPLRSAVAGSALTTALGPAGAPPQRARRRKRSPRRQPQPPSPVLFLPAIASAAPSPAGDAQGQGLGLGWLSHSTSEPILHPSPVRRPEREERSHNAELGHLMRQPPQSFSPPRAADQSPSPKAHQRKLSPPRQRKSPLPDRSPSPPQRRKPKPQPKPKPRRRRRRQRRSPVRRAAPAPAPQPKPQPKAEPHRRSSADLILSPVPRRQQQQQQQQPPPPRQQQLQPPRQASLHAPAVAPPRMAAPRHHKRHNKPKQQQPPPPIPGAGVVAWSGGQRVGPLLLMLKVRAFLSQRTMLVSAFHPASTASTTLYADMAEESVPASVQSALARLEVRLSPAARAELQLAPGTPGSAGASDARDGDNWLALLPHGRWETLAKGPRSVQGHACFVTLRRQGTRMEIEVFSLEPGRPWECVVRRGGAHTVRPVPRWSRSRFRPWQAEELLAHLTVDAEARAADLRFACDLDQRLHIEDDAARVVQSLSRRLSRWHSLAPVRECVRALREARDRTGNLSISPLLRAVVRMQALVRGNRARRMAHELRVSARNGSGDMLALPGTTNGRQGWYQLEGDVFFLDFDGAWRIVYGPISLAQWRRLLAKAAISATMVPTPGTTGGGKGFYIARGGVLARCARQKDDWIVKKVWRL